MSQPSKVECNQLMDQMTLKKDQKIGNNMYWGAQSNIQTFHKCFLQHGYRGMMTTKETTESRFRTRDKRRDANAWYDNFHKNK